MRFFFVAFMFLLPLAAQSLFVCTPGDEAVQKPWVEWLLGSQAQSRRVERFQPEAAVPPASVLLYGRSFHTPVLRLEGIRLSRSTLSPGASFTATYYFRRLSSDPMAADLRLAVHYRQGDRILINHDHDFKTPVPKWVPGALIVDGPYELKVPADTKPGDVALHFILKGVRVIGEGKATFVAPKSYFNESWLMATLKTGGADGGELDTHAGAPAQVAPLPEMADRVKRFVEEGGRLLAFGPVDAAVQRLLGLRIDTAAAVTASPLASEGWAAGIGNIAQARLAVALDAGATVEGRYQDGVPALVSRPLGKGKLYYWNGSFGRDYAMPPLRPFHDAALVRLLDHLGGLDAARATAVEAKLRSSAAKGALSVQGGAPTAAYTGLSASNFGRFGWKPFDGLLVGELTDKGSWVWRRREFTFQTAGGENEAIGLAGEWRILFDDEQKWRIEALPGDGWTPTAVPGWWEAGGLGKHRIAWYRLSVDLPPALRGKDLEWNLGGVDDFDQAWVNGVAVGATDNRTEFWWSAPRRYPVARALTSTGRLELVLRVENNKGDGGIYKSPLDLRLAGTGRKGELAVEGLTWLSKSLSQAQGDHPLKIRHSLALPGLVLETSAHELGIGDLRPLGVFYRDGAGLVVKAASEAFPWKRGPDAWQDNTLGGWFQGESADRVVPFLWVVQNRPRGVDLESTGLRLRFTGPAGRVVMLFPFGETAFTRADAEAWLAGKHQALAEAIVFWSPRALKVPVQVEERFAVDRKAGRAILADRFVYDDAPDAWRIPHPDWSALPPLVAFDMAGGHSRWEGSAPMLKTGCLTAQGPLVVSEGAELAYSLPLAPLGHFGIVDRSGNEALRKSAGEHFALPARWAWRFSKKENGAWKTWGGQEMAKRFPSPLGMDFYDLSGLRRVTAGVLTRFLLSGDELSLMERQLETYRLVWNFLQPAALQEVRREPYTGLRYPVNTIFTTGNETYNDVNEFCGNQQSFDWAAAQYGGDWRTAASTWSFSQYQASFLWRMHDWAYLASGCREYGLGSFIDMLDSEMPGSIAHQRLARALGDRDGEDFFAYLGARQAVALRARMVFQPYARSLGLVPSNLAPDDAVITGFRENGFDQRPISARRMPPYLYDTAGIGIPCETMLYHKLYAFPAVLAFEAGVDRYCPDWREEDVLGGPWCRLFARSFLPGETAGLVRDLETVDAACAPLWREGRWGNYANTPGMLIARENHFFLQSWPALALRKAAEEKSVLTLQGELVASAPVVASLECFSRGKVIRCLVNGTPSTAWKQDPDGMVVLDLARVAPGPFTAVIESAKERVYTHPYFPDWKGK